MHGNPCMNAGKLVVIDSFNLTPGECGANDGNEIHYELLVFQELRLFLYAIGWRTRTGWRADARRVAFNVSSYGCS